MEGLRMKDGLTAGWAEADITPGGKVYLIGQHCARVSEGVMDPVTATALVLESGKNGQTAGHVVMVSCDLVAISDKLREAVRGYVSEEPGLKTGSIILNATHTHAAPHIRPSNSFRHFGDGKTIPPDGHPYGIELDAMRPEEYVDFSAKKIAKAVKKAWNSRKPSGIGYGLVHAVIGRNRRLTYKDGESTMYGKADVAGFSHVEGYEDHSVYVMTVYDKAGSLTGIVVNVSCPSQVSENIYRISADFWHETREEIRKRFGKELFILAQCAPAGDQSPHVLVGKRAEERMWRLKDRDIEQNAPRREIAEKIADAVGHVLPCAEKEIDREPGLMHRAEVVELPRRKISQKDVDDASMQAKKHREKYEELLKEIKRNPALKKESRWYTSITAEYARMKWFNNVRRRFEAQQENPSMPVELHALSLGDVAFAANPFELYLDYGIRMRELSPAVQTFLIQLAGPGGYLPSERSVKCGGYGSVPASTDVGPEGGEQLVEWTVKTINSIREKAGTAD